MIGSFHIRSTVKRRGGILPARLRFSARRGVTLVELMISMLILTIVCISWLQIIGIQSARKEARRREAVERLAGMMDAFMYSQKKGTSVGLYQLKWDTSKDNIYFEKENQTDDVFPMFDGSVSPIGYRLCVVKKNNLYLSDKFENWNTTGRDFKGYWLVGYLYNSSGCSESEAGRPFFTLPVCLGL